MLGKQPSIIYICGADGVGKSSLLEAFEEELQSAGYKTTKLWMRFHHYLAKAVNALGHALGLSYYETSSDGTKYGYHDYYKSTLLSLLFIFATIVDSSFAILIRLHSRLLLSKRVFLLDRFVYDILIDMIIDTKRPKLWNNFVGKFLKLFIPSQTLKFCITLDYETVIKRRESLAFDRTLQDRLSYYQTLVANEPGVIAIENSKPMNEVLDQVKEHVGFNEN